MNPNNPRSTRRPITPALMRARGSAAAAALAAVLVCATHAAPAEAALSSVSPGDRIATPDLCTIGYTYTGTDAHTYALTAGHCASPAPVRDQSTGATGTFVASIVDPPRSGGADYGLVDFGPRTVALTVISGRAAARKHTRPRPGQTVCSIRNHHRRAVRQHRGSLRRSPVPDHRYAAEPRWRFRSTRVGRRQRWPRPGPRYLAGRAHHGRWARLRTVRRAELRRLRIGHHIRGLIPRPWRRRDSRPPLFGTNPRVGMRDWPPPAAIGSAAHSPFSRSAGRRA